MNEPTDALDSEPVFVDPSGRRRRIARNVGIAAGCLLAAYLATVMFAVVTGSRAPLTPWPEGRASAGAVAPGDDVLRHAPLHTATAPRTRPGTATPASGTAPTAAAPAPASSPTHASSTRTSATPTPALPGRGHAYGRTRAPHPKKS